MKKSVWKAGTNGKKGWYFLHEDGFCGWIRAYSAAERTVAERKHGKLLKWEAAK